MSAPQPPCPKVMEVHFGHEEWNFVRERYGSRGKDHPFYCPHFRLPNHKTVLGFAPVDAMAGVPLWRAADGGHVFRWSTDMVACGDERWTVFGPFATLEDARLAYRKIERFARRLRCELLGFRIVGEHCYPYLFHNKCGVENTCNYPRDIWTDG